VGGFKSGSIDCYSNQQDSFKGLLNEKFGAVVIVLRISLIVM
jgi:hypothetical protein